MKLKKNIILLAILLGLAFGLVDSVIHYLTSTEGTLLEVMITNPPKDLVFVRFIFMVVCIVFGIIISRYITKHEEAEAALKESELKYRKLFENAGDAIFIVELEGENAGQIVSANQAAATMHDYSVDEITGMSIKELDCPEAAKVVPERIQRLLRGEWLREEINHRKKDGTIFPVEINVGLLEISGRKYALAFDRDITTRKLAENALKKSETELREQKIALEQKNINLQGILKEIELEKKRIQEQVTANVRTLLLPSLHTLKISCKQPGEQKHINLLEQNLEEITSTFGIKLTKLEQKLAPKEIEVSNFVRNGLTNKEIAGLLNISLRTVETHRQNIRKKLGLAHKNANLAIYLKSL